MGTVWEDLWRTSPEEVPEGGSGTADVCVHYPCWSPCESNAFLSFYAREHARHGGCAARRAQHVLPALARTAEAGPCPCNTSIATA